MRSIPLTALVALAACGAPATPARPAPTTARHVDSPIATAAEPTPEPSGEAPPLATRTWDAMDAVDGVARDGGQLILLQQHGNASRLAVADATGAIDATVIERWLERMAVARDAAVVVGQTSEGAIGDLGSEELVVYALPDLQERARWHREATTALAMSPDGRWIAAAGGGAIDLYRVDGALVRHHVLVPESERDPDVPSFWYSTTQAMSVANDGTIVAARCDTTIDVLASDGARHSLRTPWVPPDPAATPAPCEPEDGEDGGRHCSYVPPNPDQVIRFFRRGDRLLAVTYEGAVVEWRRTTARARPRVLVAGGCRADHVLALWDGDLSAEDSALEREACARTRSAHLTADGDHVVLQSFEAVARRASLRRDTREVGRVPDMALVLGPADTSGETVWLVDGSGRPRRWSPALGDWVEEELVLLR